MENVEQQIAELQKQVKDLSKDTQDDKISIIVFSGDLDKVLAAFNIALGASAMGMDVVLFFTFWGTPVLRDKKKKGKGKDIISKMFGFMLPKGAGKLKLSQMNMGGAGTLLMKHLMKKKNVSNIEEMLKLSAEMEINVYICELSMDLMGFQHEEMIEYPNLVYCGVAKFIEEAKNSKVQLFI
ncbi:MAG: DsrE/DsrF/DrsH-like family protein [Spirochaetota bacterium]|nr:DsrE/DsrF/DrsH-like family protein [Spirochaetota bacterium]